MDDFRVPLYNRYVSTFKTQPLSESQVRSTWKWYDAKYLPLLRDVPPSHMIVELGCGPGLMLRYLRQKGFTHLKGIDISAEQIALAAQFEPDVEVADVFEFLDRDGSRIDGVIALDFFEHFTKNEVMRLLSQIRRRMAEGGFLLLQTPNGEGLFPNQVIYGDLTHSTILNASSLEQVLRFNGFTDIQFFETGPDRTGLKSLVRLLFWRIIRSCATAIRIIETGKRQRIWTENIICLCRVPAPSGSARH